MAGFASADPERSTERSIVTVLVDLSGSMNTKLNTEETDSRGEVIRTRLDALTAGVIDLVSPTSGISMHSAKDFDGTAEFAIGSFKGSTAPHVTWCTFLGARVSGTPFYFGKDITALPNEPFLASGNTPIGESLLEALPLIEERRTKIRASGLSVKRPILFLITDGRPSTTAYIEARKQIAAAENARRLLFFAIGTYDADQQMLSQIAPRSAYDLHGRPISKLIEFLSTTTGTVLASDPDAGPEEIKILLQEQWAVSLGRSRTAQDARAIIE